MDSLTGSTVGEGGVTVLLKGEKIKLLPGKVLYWVERKLMIVSDVHLGKAGHFRKHGIAVPGNIHVHDQQQLSDLLLAHTVDDLVFLGDLFHSDANAEWHLFAEWARSIEGTRLTLVRGNHDILPLREYQACGLNTVERLTLGPFSLTHQEEVDDQYYNISGHLHPAIKLRGAAKQGLKLPCFFFRPNHAYMPAFGNFTGLYTLRKRREDKVFAVTGNRVMRVN
ncbi:MAG: ligase-associated DNA damage response endonuclease PdeM [Bacteroidota bacterium]